MTFRAFSLDFDVQGGICFPRDKHLHDMVVRWMEKELARPIDPTRYRKIFVLCSVDENGKPLSVHGLMAGLLKFDWEVVRFTDAEGADELFERARGYLEDNGLRGQESFLFIAHAEEESARCPKWREFLKRWQARNAQRWSVQV